MGKLTGGILDENAISAIYKDYEPAFSNLYTIEMYSSSLDRDENRIDLSMNDYIKFHATDVSFDDETLNLERNDVTKNFQLKTSDQYTWPTMLKITWREADDWRVKKYHENWIGKFYSKEKDCFFSHTEREALNLYKNIVVHLPYTKVGDDKYEERSIYFLNVLPNNIGSFSFKWGTSGEIVTHQLTYFVKEWKWATDKKISEN